MRSRCKLFSGVVEREVVFRINLQFCFLLVTLPGFRLHALSLLDVHISQKECHLRGSSLNRFRRSLRGFTSIKSEVLLSLDCC